MLKTSAFYCLDLPGFVWITHLQLKWETADTKDNTLLYVYWSWSPCTLRHQEWNKTFSYCSLGCYPKVDLLLVLICLVVFIFILPSYNWISCNLFTLSYMFYHIFPEFEQNNTKFELLHVICSKNYAIDYCYLNNKKHWS